MKTRSFVITTLQPWDALPISDIHRLAFELSKRARVLYVNPPLDMMSLMNGSGRREIDRRCRVLSGSESVLRHVNRNLWVLEPPILITQPAKVYSERVFEILVKRNNRRFAEMIRWAVDYINMDDFTLLVDNDIIGSQYLDEYLDPICLAYYRRHDMQSAEGVSNSIKRMERSLVAKSDVVFATSRILAEQVEEYNGNTFDIGRGTALDGFDPNRKGKSPNDIMSIRGPIIGCEHTVLGEHTVAADLLYRVAKAYNDCSMVLIGGEDAYMASHELHDLPNVYFLGGKDDKELPDYISKFDICLCAQPDNTMTRVNYPDNIVRYLAMGKSVVANNTEPVRQFASKIHLALDDVEFIGLVGVGLYEGASLINVPQWSNYAHRYVWANCVERILTVLDMFGYDDFEDVDQVVREQSMVYS